MGEVNPAPGTAQVPVGVVLGQPSIAIGDVSAQYVEPSKTIFARGLAPALSEFEFIHLFQKHPGFISARVKKNKDGSPIGFAEFDTLENSVAAKEAVEQECVGTELILEYSHTSRRGSRSRHFSFASRLCLNLFHPVFNPLETFGRNNHLDCASFEQFSQRSRKNRGLSITKCR